MPETKLEQSLAAAADTFEACVTPEVRADIEKLCGAGQKPNMNRQLNGCPGHTLLLEVVRTEELTSAVP